MTLQQLIAEWGGLSSEQRFVIWCLVMLYEPTIPTQQSTKEG
jgi:hypothetical protein